MPSQQSKGKEDLPRAEKAFYTALKILGYEKVVHGGEDAMFFEGRPKETVNELLFILDNIYRTALAVTMDAYPKEENLIASKKFLEHVNERLSFATVDIMEKMLEREAEAEK